MCRDLYVDVDDDDEWRSRAKRDAGLARVLPARAVSRSSTLLCVATSHGATASNTRTAEIKNKQYLLNEITDVLTSYID